MAIVLCFVFVAVLIGGMLLMLVLGYEIRAERATQDHDLHTASPIVDGRRFFANLGGGVDPGKVPVAPFAERSLSGHPTCVDAMARELERRIQRETASTARFLTEPSFDSLFGAPDAHALSDRAGSTG